MDSEEQKKSKSYFKKKSLNIYPLNKYKQNHDIELDISPNDIYDINDKIKKLLKKDEEIITKYLERIIYTSILPEQIITNINKICNDIDNKIIHGKT
jgi:hypothetical protein